MTVSKQSQNGTELVIKKKFLTMHGLMYVKVTMFILLMLAILVNEAVATVFVGFVCAFLGVEHDACILILFLHRFLEFCQSCYS
jgi:ABC-type multidrug transport system permease subunit